MDKSCPRIQGEVRLEASAGEPLCWDAGHRLLEPPGSRSEGCSAASSILVGLGALGGGAMGSYTGHAIRGCGRAQLRLG